MRKAKTLIRVVEYPNHSFENNYEAEQAMNGLKTEAGEAHEQLMALEKRLQNALYQLIESYIDENGEEKTVEMLFELKRWHPWSYEYCSEIMDILRGRGKEHLVAKICRRIYGF